MGIRCRPLVSNDAQSRARDGQKNRNFVPSAREPGSEHAIIAGNLQGRVSYLERYLADPWQSVDSTGATDVEGVVRADQLSSRPCGCIGWLDLRLLDAGESEFDIADL